VNDPSDIARVRELLCQIAADEACSTFELGLIPVLVGFGVTALSVAPDAIVRTKRLVRRLSAGSARALADEVIHLPTAAAATARLRELEGCAFQDDVHAPGEAR
jgi:phosphoenolpyruvate-protein kinase (PTS system EI component)